MSAGEMPQQPPTIEQPELAHSHACAMAEKGKMNRAHLRVAQPRLQQWSHGRFTVESGAAAHDSCLGGRRGALVGWADRRGKTRGRDIGPPTQKTVANTIRV